MAETRSDRERVLADAWLAETGGWIPGGAADSVTRLGWTVAEVRRVCALARVVRGPQINETLPPAVRAGLRITVVAGTLVREVERLAEAGLPVAEALDWLTVETCRVGLEVRADRDVLPLAVDEVRDWRRLGVAAPLAWAAGLTVEEACARAAVGTPTGDEWRTMAGLRGYRLDGTEAVRP